MIYRFVVHGRSEHAFKADAIGKAATIAEILAIAALIARSRLIVPLALLAAALGLIAVIHYIARGLARSNADQLSASGRN
jgi:hypothetical protein